MTTTSEGALRLIPNGDLDEMELIGNRIFTVGVAADADPEFKAYILAAGSTYARGNRSVDNTLRKHCTKWVEQFELQAQADTRSLVGLRRAVLRFVSPRCEVISNLDLGDSPSAGLIAAANVLIRLDSTFRAASHLVQLGFAFESEAVIRLGFEQVAWCIAVRHLTESEDVAKVNGTGHVTKLKSIFPGAGPIYGRLSELAHVAPATHTRFMIGGDDGMMIRIKAPMAATESMRLLLVLMDAFLVVGEECFEHVGMPCDNLDPVTHGLKEDRPARRLIEEFGRVLPPGTKSFFDAWWK